MYQKSGDTTEIVRLVNGDFDILSHKINNLFPNERQAFYYVPPKCEGPSQKVSKGKLPDFYRNKLDECRQIGLVQKKRKRIDDIDDILESNINLTTKRVCKTHLQWLQYNTAPWSSVEEHWNKSRELRHILIAEHKVNIYDIFSEYPVLKQELGYTLLENDYNSLINKKSNIYSKWPELSKKLETLLTKRVMKDKTFAKRLEEIQLYEEGD
ncbi:uncharacterized protein LOC112463699, partial [Temnothorax curvispinosus]|uniref:Uncharacterized protein LOC112463699 n=1 Tax=Temnothorax curvispinosus TaxID=300111 RepID=A0A6J1QU49_9HYME